MIDLNIFNTVVYEESDEMIRIHTTILEFHRGEEFGTLMLRRLRTAVYLTTPVGSQLL